MKTNFRRNIRNRERKIEKLGAYNETVGKSGDGPEAARAAARRLVDIADDSWRGTELGPMPELFRSNYADTAEAFDLERPRRSTWTGR